MVTVRRKFEKTTIAAIAAVGLGLFFGMLRPAFLEQADAAALAAALRVFVTEFDPAALGLGAMVESLLRYGRLLVLIWACAAFPKAFYAAYLVLYLHSMTLGFSAAMLAYAFGGRGVGYAMGLYLLQNLIILPVCAYTVCFIAKNPLRGAAGGVMKAVIKIVTAGILCVVLVAVLEVYVVPWIFGLLL